MIKRTILGGVIATLLIAGGPSAMAQAGAGTKSDEQVLRELIQQLQQSKERPKFTDEAIFVSGLDAQPTIGRQKREAARPAMEEKLKKERPNESTKIMIERLVVSKSGDMAYEFTNFISTWDGPDKTRTGFNGSYLRVWLKIGGEWKVDATFARPNKD